MKSTMRVAIILAVVFCLVLVQSAIAGKSVKPQSIWNIFKDGTAQSVPWVDAANPRFAVYGGMVLDKETGLVWEQTPYTGPDMHWTSAISHCYQREVANRKGWRLPTVEELASLVDNDNVNPALPTGHPFSNVHGSFYWSSTSIETREVTEGVWAVEFLWGGVEEYGKGGHEFVWCVRGGQGHDGY